MAHTIGEKELKRSYDAGGYQGRLMNLVATRGSFVRRHDKVGMK